MNQATMQALVVETPAGPFERKTLPRPEAAAGQVLVRIHASGINPLDTKIRAGRADHAQQALPAVLGIDLAGVVEAVGEGVSGFAPGDAVYGMTGGVGGVQGSLAEYAAVDAALLAKAPANWSLREAAALPLVFITAWEGLVERAQVRQGQKVLIHGGAGGIGHVAIQLARARGAEVYATASAANLEVVRALGATPIDYTTTTVEQYVAEYTGGEGFDIVFDTVGGSTLDASFVAARTYGGHVLSALGWGTHKLAPLSFRAATYSGVFTLRPLLTGKGRTRHGEIMAEATKLADAGLLRVRVDERRFHFDNVAEAHALVEAGDGRGKLVVEVITAA
ncbi:zinc-dependent alcohol dehydrogenase family protein [Chitinimonas sp.]|uniref:zinc-dependent alcohol dehydrogenase family protein n=1 Tax=Chitinimonas sp. TaxID=1934313 RepID=UPI002F95BD5F